jgi:hypothetical protein
MADAASSSQPRIIMCPRRIEIANDHIKAIVEHFLMITPSLKSDRAWFISDRPWLLSDRRSL